MHSNIPSAYTWHTPVGVRFTEGPFPKADAIIATGYSSVPSTVDSNIPVKTYYVRGLELWRTGTHKLVKSFKAFPFCIVNSAWLCEFMRSVDVQAILVRPGLDTEDFYDMHKDRENTLGGLYSERHRTKRHIDVISAGEMAGCDVELLNRDIKEPTIEEQRLWYNKLKVWMAPSELEGLHNPPIEAALCGCALVLTDHPRAGTSDYSLPTVFNYVYKARDIQEASKYIRVLLSNEPMRKRMAVAMRERLVNIVGSRDDNMKTLVELLE